VKFILPPLLVECRACGLWFCQWGRFTASTHRSHNMPWVELAVMRVTSHPRTTVAAYTMAGKDFRRRFPHSAINISSYLSAPRGAVCHLVKLVWVPSRRKLTWRSWKEYMQCAISRQTFSWPEKLLCQEGSLWVIWPRFSPGLT